MKTIPYGATDVEVEFIHVDQFSLDRGIVIETDKIEVKQVPVGEMEPAKNFSSLPDGDFSDDDDRVQFSVGDSGVPDTYDFFYRTVFSELDGISKRTACMIELPD